MCEEAYETPSLRGDQADALALKFLKQFDQMPISIVRQVLDRVDFWIDATQKVDCGATTEFARAFEALWRAADESP